MKKGIIFIVMLLLVAQQLSPVYSSDLTDDYFDIATNYFNSNNYIEALEYLDSVLKLEPDNLQAMTLRNKISPPKSCKTGAGAQVVVENVVKTENSVVLNVSPINIEKTECNPQYYILKGIEFYNRCEFDVAVEYFFKAISVDGSNAVAYNNLALSYQAKNVPTLAILYFKKANSLNKSYTQPLINLATLYNKLGQGNKVVYYLKKAIRLNNKDYQAYYNLGEYYRSKSCFSKSIPYYKSAIKLNPTFAGSYIHLANSFIETEQYDYALIALNQYLGLKPNSDYAYFMIAKSYFGLSQLENAKSAINKAIVINCNGDYLFELAKINYNQGDYKSALDNFNTLLRTGSGSAEIFNYIGLCNFELKKYDFALANFNKAVAIDSLRPIYYYDLALCVKAMGDDKNFAKYLKAATAINPIIYEDFVDLSNIYLCSGDSASALRVLGVATKKYTYSKNLYLAKAKIYQANKDTLHYNETMDFIRKRFN